MKKKVSKKSVRTHGRSESGDVLKGEVITATEVRTGKDGRGKVDKDGRERPWMVKWYFKKGDPRINSRGAPKPFAHVHKLAQSIGDEQVEITVGEGSGKQSLVMTRTELILLDWSMSSNPTKQELFMRYAHGNVPNVNYNANMTVLLRKFANKLTDAELARVKDGEPLIDILIAKIPSVMDGDE